MQKGFTLIEAAIAMVIVAVGIICVVSMQSTSALGNNKSFLISTASSFAEETMEGLLARDYDDIASTVADLNASGAQFHLVATVVEDIPLADCKEITCQVDWNTSSLRYVYVRPKY